jgi:HSP20 family protein
MSYYIKNNNSIDSIFNSFFENLYKQDNVFSRKSNIINDDDSIIIEVEAPGLSKKDINIQIKEDILYVVHEGQTDCAQKYSQQEIFFESFENKYKLENSMDKKNISATMNNGILKIKIPKNKNKNNTRIKIT